MQWLRYLLCLLFIFIMFPAYAGDNDTRFYRPENDGYFEKSDAEGLSPIILDLAISLYKSERLAQALRQFNIVLALHPGDKTALKYVKIIKKRLGEPEEEAVAEQERLLITESLDKEEKETTAEEEAATQELPLSSDKAGLYKEEFISKQIDGMMLYDEPARKPAKEKPAAKEKPVPKKKVTAKAKTTAKKKPAAKTKKTAKAKETAKEKVTTTTGIPKILILNPKTKKPAFSLEVEQNEIISIKGEKITRFLLTQPDVISIEKSTDVLFITGKNIGKTYLHIWDSQQRWTVEFKTIPKKQKGFGAEDEDKYAEERAKELKIRYAMITNYNKTVNHSSTVMPRYRYRSFQHILESATPLETPNGDFGFSVSVNSLPEKTEMNYASLRWLNGKIGTFDKINLQAIDFRPERTDLAFSKADLRGVQVSAPLADNKLRTNFFWGEELGLRFGGFIPTGIEFKKQQIYYSGLNLDYLAEQEHVYSLSAYKTWGKDRAPGQNEYAYDLKAHYDFDKLKLIPELAFDTENYASNLIIDYTLPSLKVITELRNISKDFQAVSGKDYRAGQKGVLVDASYRPSEKIIFSNKIDFFSDDLYPNPDLPDRWNKEVSLGSLWSPLRLIEIQGDYNYRNYMGKNFPTISQGTGVGMRYKLPIERRVNLYLNYNRNRNRYIRTPILDYLSNKITAGSIIGLFPSIYGFVEKETNRITQLSNSESATPKALQTGLEWSAQLYDTGIYQLLRFTYRDEEDTASPFSFMVGEDYIEGYGETVYAPTPNFNFGLTVRAKNIRTEAAPVGKRFEAEILAGLNYLFNTHFRIDPVGTIEGYVFQDENLDGIKQPDEPAIPGVELRIVGKRIQSTNRSGAYKFMNVKAKKVYISINPTTIPTGFILTGPAIREAIIFNKDKTILNFGVSSRTEIQGVVFEDTDGDYKFGLHDKGVAGVALVFEDGSRMFTDSYGGFSKRVNPGKYRIKLDLASIPEDYMPMVPIFADFELAEGQSLNYTVPLLKFK